jgi:hypothetical protein
MSTIAESKLRNRLIQLLVTCRSTYAFDSETDNPNFIDAHAVSIFIKCSIILRNHLPSELTQLPAHLRHLVERDYVLSAETLPSLLRSVSPSEATCCGLDDAVKFAWNGFIRDPVIEWRMIGDRWKACETVAADDTAQIRYVYLNLLDGTLLVDGQTFGNLPKEILSNRLFKQIFPLMVWFFLHIQLSNLC